MIITATTTAQHIQTLSLSIIDNAKAGVKLSKVIKEICTPPTDLATTDEINEFRQELANILTSARAHSEAQAKDYIDTYLGKRDAASIPAFKKSITNAWTYARKIAGEAAGCEFKYAQTDKCFSVVEAKAAKEPTAKAPASGREAGINTAIHEANKVAGEAASIDLPSLPASDDKSKVAKQARAARLQAAKKAVRGLIHHGFTAAELAEAFQAVMESAALKGAELDGELANQLAMAH